MDWLLNDHHGTANITVNAATKAITKRWLDPFGNPRATVPTWTTDKGFLGGTKDDTGFTHLGAREYNPAMGRFIAVDPLMDLSDPATLNAYSYGANNPATYSDPSGLMNDADMIDDGTGGAGYNPTERKIAFEYCQGRHGKQCAGEWRQNTWRNYHDDYMRANFTWEERMRHQERLLSPAEAARLKARADLINSLVLQAIPYLGNIETARVCHQNFTADCALMFVPGGGLARAGERTALRALREGDEAADVGKYIGKSCATGAKSFAGDTRVLMADGTTKPIKNIKPGDEVLTTDPETGEQAAKTVTAVWVHKDKLVDLELRTDSDKDGKPDRVTTTEDHPFWNATDHQWQQAHAINSGDAVLTADGRLTTVAGIVWSTLRSGAAYNLTVADIHTYYVHAGSTPILAHNVDCGMVAAGDLGEFKTVHGLDPDNAAKLRKLSNGELFDSFNNPKDGAYALVTRDGRIMNGHHRIAELQRRVQNGEISPDARVRIDEYVPDLPTSGFWD